MSFEIFFKALRQLLEPVAVKADAGKGELEGVVMKKAKTAKAKSAKAAPKKAAAKVATKPAAKKAEKPKASVAAKTAKAPKAPAKPKMISTKAVEAPKAPATKASKPTKPTKAEAKTTKAIELAQKAALAASAPAPSTPARTLKEALAGNIKKASEMEPNVVLEEAQQDVTEQEKKALARKLAQAGTNYESVYKIAKSMKPRNYKMSESFEVRTPIMHKILGWGFILMSENNRIQVLFKDGVKTLITNYQK